MGFSADIVNLKKKEDQISKGGYISKSIFFVLLSSWNWEICQFANFSKVNKKLMDTNFFLILKIWRKWKYLLRFNSLFNIDSENSGVEKTEYNYVEIKYVVKNYF